MTVDSLQAYVRQLKDRIQVCEYEPEFDDKDEKKDKVLRWEVIALYMWENC